MTHGTQEAPGARDPSTKALRAGARIHILFVIQGSALNRGMTTGVENLAWRLSKTPIFRVTILSGGTRPASDTPFIRENRAHISRIEYVFLGTQYPSRVFARSLRREVVVREPDVVIGWTRLVVHLSAKHKRALRAHRYHKNIPVVIVGEGEDLRLPRRLERMRATWRTQLRFLMHSVGQLKQGRIGPRGGIAAAIGNSDAVAQSLIQTYGIAPHRVKTIPRGVDTSLFTFEGSRDEYRLPRSLITTGDIVSRKGYGVVADALGYVQDPVRWTVVGHGRRPYLEEIRGRVEGFGHSFCHIEAVPHSQLAKILREHSIFVLMSQTEGLSKSLIEAMASGCVPVVSGLAAFRQTVIPELTGFVGPTVPSRLGGLLEYLLSNATDLSAVRTAARNHVLRHNSAEAETETWSDAILSELALRNNM